MGYWNTSRDGTSFAEGRNADGSEMLWGDAPADAIGDGMDALVKRLRKELGRYPSVEEIDSLKFGDAVHHVAPEIVKAIRRAEKVFREDIGREMTLAELTAGLRFSDTSLHLEMTQERDYAPGDLVRFAKQDGNGRHVRLDAAGEYPDDVGTSHRAGELVVLRGRLVELRAGDAIVDVDGELMTIGRAWISKILEGGEMSEPTGV